MTRFLADENFAAAVTAHLRVIGYDVLTCVEAGIANRGTSDADVLAAAASDRRTVLTYNRKHFIRLHDVGGPHAGIVVCTEDRDYVGQAARIAAAVRAAPTLDCQLIRVNRPS